MHLSAKAHQRIARVLAAWCLVFLAVLAGKPSFTNASVPVRGVADPVVALQMARNAAEVEAILGEAPSADREVMRVKQYIDFALIGGYFSLAMVIAAALIRIRYRSTAILIGVLAILAAIHDVRENLLTLRIVNLSLSRLPPYILDELRLMSMTKWVFLAIAIALLSVITVTRKQWYLRTAGILGFIGAALTIGGLFYNSILAWGGVFMFLGLLLTAATLKVLTHESAS